MAAAGAAALLSAASHAVAALPSNCSLSGSRVSCMFSPTGSEQTFTVPSGVTTVSADAVGAPGAGGELFGASGGAGGTASRSFAVTDGQTLYVEVGTAGSASRAGWNGGGAGGATSVVNGSRSDGGGGGGASDVRRLPDSAAGSLSSRTLVAGGGGGGGGGNSGLAAGVGGAAGSAGTTASTSCAGGGGGAGSAGGGTAGVGGSCYGSAGTAGASAAGGDGGAITGALNQGGGGGGGGGYYGGGGAGGGVTGGGGGGGSSYAPGGTKGVDASGSPRVTITYTPASPTATISSPAGVGALNQGQAAATAFSCAEAPGGPGLVSCQDSNGTSTSAAGAGTLDTTTAGTHTYTVTATSRDGQTGTAQITYTVTPTPRTTTTTSTTATPPPATTTTTTTAARPAPKRQSTTPSTTNTASPPSATTTTTSAPAQTTQSGNTTTPAAAVTPARPRSTVRPRRSHARPKHFKARRKSGGTQTGRRRTSSPTPHRSPRGPDGSTSRGSTSPSALTDSLPTVGRVLRHPEKIALAVLAGMVWTLWLVLVLNGLQKPLSRRYRAWSGFLRRHMPKTPIDRLAWLRRLAGDRWLALVGLELLNGAVLGFVDPHFGFNPESLRLLLSTAAGAVLGTVTPDWITISIARERWQAAPRQEASLWGLVLGGAGVAASRLLRFLPGLLTGKAIVFDSGEGTVEQRVNVQRLRVGLTIAFGVICWLIANAIPGTGNWVTLWARDAAVAASVVALTTMLLEAVPLAFFAGSVLLPHAPRSWALLTAINGCAFALIVAPQPNNWLDVGSRESWWLTVASIIAAAAIALIVILHRAELRRRPPDAPGTSAHPAA